MRRDRMRPFPKSDDDIADAIHALVSHLATGEELPEFLPAGTVVQVLAPVIPIEERRPPPPPPPPPRVDFDAIADVVLDRLTDALVERRLAHNGSVARRGGPRS